MTQVLRFLCVSVFWGLTGGGVCHAQTENTDLVTVHIYRPDLLYGFGWTYKLKVGDSLLVKVSNNSIQTIKLPPGQWQFQVKDIGKSNFVLNAEAGKEYYIRGSFRGGLFLGVPQILEVTPEFARQEMAGKELKPVGNRK